MIALLSLPVAAIALPWQWGFVHPVSILIVGGYIYGVRQGIANIGFESLLVLVLYITTVAVLV